MFTVIELETGKLVTVYAVQGQLFLICDEFGWGYKHMNCFLPVIPEEVSKDA